MKIRMGLRRCFSGNLLAATLLAITSTGHAASLVDYGESRWLIPKAGKAVPFRWLQIGDSHTAGDYFTGEIRRVMQERYGNGGPGWLPPGNVPEQRSDSVRITNEGSWNVHKSTLPQDEPVSFGGFSGFDTEQARSGFAIALKDPMPERMAQLTLIFPQDSHPGPTFEISSNGEEDAAQVATRLEPKHNFIMRETGAILSIVTRTIGTESTKLAGVAVDYPEGGAIVDAVGVNGATLRDLAAWDEASWRDFLAFRMPNLVVLAIGTNDAVAANVDEENLGYLARLTVRRIRTYSKAAVLIVGPPGFSTPKQAGLRDRGPRCGPIPPSLAAVITVLRLTAQRERTLWWDWRKALGDPCDEKQRPTEAADFYRPDFVHLTPEGYQYSARILLRELSLLDK